MSRSASGVTRLVSGGQTGADRAALDVAAVLAIAYGGWCPSGGRAEDLEEPPGLLASYPGLRETPSEDPAVRTRWNVRDSDATLVLLLGSIADSPGTVATVACAARLGRPLLVVPADDVEAVRSWLESLPGPVVLNVAGPRESQHPGLYAAAALTLQEVLGA